MWTHPRYSLTGWPQASGFLGLRAHICLLRALVGEGRNYRLDFPSTRRPGRCTHIHTRRLIVRKTSGAQTDSVSTDRWGAVDHQFVVTQNLCSLGSNTPPTEACGLAI